MNGGTSAGSPPRLKPEMASLKLLVLDFVRGYIERWQGSPSYGEIAAALNTNRSRIKRAVRSLAAEGLLLRTPGPRGLALPDTQAEAVAALRALGWTVDETDARVTKTPLPALPVLDYPGPGHGDSGGSEKDGIGH